jgi:hypothetical protein
MHAGIKKVHAQFHSTGAGTQPALDKPEISLWEKEGGTATCQARDR